MCLTKVEGERRETLINQLTGFLGPMIDRESVEIRVVSVPFYREAILADVDGVGRFIVAGLDDRYVISPISNTMDIHLLNERLGLILNDATVEEYFRLFVATTTTQSGTKFQILEPKDAFAGMSRPPMELVNKGMDEEGRYRFEATVLLDGEGAADCSFAVQLDGRVWMLGDDPIWRPGIAWAERKTTVH